MTGIGHHPSARSTATRGHTGSLADDAAWSALARYLAAGVEVPTAASPMTPATAATTPATAATASAAGALAAELAVGSAHASARTDPG